MEILINILYMETLYLLIVNIWECDKLINSHYYAYSSKERAEKMEEFLKGEEDSIMFRTTYEIREILKDA